MRSRPGPGALAVALLVAVTATWGSTFFLIRDLVAVVPPADFLAVRFCVAALVMTLVFRRHVRALTAPQWRAGLSLGAVYAAAQVVQTIGLQHTSASVSGFITGTYVVLTPVLAAVVLRERITAVVWLAVGLATVGLAVLSLRGMTVGTGESLTLLGALLYAVHILMLGRWSSAGAAVGLATVQAGTIATLSTVMALPGGIALPQSPGQWASLIYMAVVAGAGALWAQTWAQAHLSATRAAIIMTLEPVFAALFAVLLGGELLTARMLLGGGLVLVATYLAEVPTTRDDVPAHRDPPTPALHHEP